jgi:hypothetical protein
MPGETVTPRPINYAALKAELADPKYLGWGDNAITSAINGKQVASPIPAIIPIAKIMNSFDADELLAMPANQMAALNLLLRGDTVDVTASSSVRALLTAVFLDKSKSLAKLVALVQQYDAAQAPWVQTVLGVPSVVQADLVQARAS